MMAVRGAQYRNQTVLHEWLGKQTYPFLRQRCTARGVIWRQEHTLHNGMRPDAVAFCSLQMGYERQMIGRYLKAKFSADIMFVFESKASYADYKNTFNGDGEGKEKPYGNLHYLVVPKGFSKAYDMSNLPDHWGILEPKVSALQIIRHAKYVEIDRSFFLEAAYTILFKWGSAFELYNREDILKQELGLKI